MSTSVGACGKSDDQQVKDLVIRLHEAWNEKDWRTQYEMSSPNYWRTVSYEEFVAFGERMWDQFVSAYGTGQMELEEGSIEVRIEGEWAYATYIGWIGGMGLDLAKLGEEDVWRKVDGKWYDVAEHPDDPGYNKEDLPTKAVAGGTSSSTTEGEFVLQLDLSAVEPGEEAAVVQETCALIHERLQVCGQHQHGDMYVLLSGGDRIIIEWRGVQSSEFLDCVVAGRYPVPVFPVGSYYTYSIPGLVGEQGRTGEGGILAFEFDKAVDMEDIKRVLDESLWAGNFVIKTKPGFGEHRRDIYLRGTPSVAEKSALKKFLEERLGPFQEVGFQHWETCQ